MITSFVEVAVPKTKLSVNAFELSENDVVVTAIEGVPPAGYQLKAVLQTGVSPIIYDPAV